MVHTFLKRSTHPVEVVNLLLRADISLIICKYLKSVTKKSIKNKCIFPERFFGYTEIKLFKQFNFSYKPFDPT